MLVVTAAAEILVVTWRTATIDLSATGERRQEGNEAALRLIMLDF